MVASVFVNLAFIRQKIYHVKLVERIVNLVKMVRNAPFVITDLN